MPRRLVILVLLILLVTAAPALAAKDYSADRFDVEAVIQPDGSLLVTETVVFRFVGGPFTTAFRNVPTAETDGITDVVASMDGTVLPPGKEAGQVEISHGNEVRVRWHYEPTSDSVHTFVLSYRMLGVVRQSRDADVLSWRPLPTDHDYRIASSTVRVSYPAAAQLVDSPQVRKGQATATVRTGYVLFQAADLGKDDSYELALRFAPGSLISAPPGWQSAEQEQAKKAPYAIVASLAILAASLLWTWNTWMGNRRVVETAPVGELSVMRAPSDLPPALAGLLKDGNHDVQWRHGFAALLDLARRGVLVIEEMPTKGWFRQRDFLIRRGSPLSNGRPHEVGLLRFLFESKKGTEDSVKISDLSSRLASRWKEVAQPLQEEMRTAGLWDTEQEDVRRRFLIVAGSTFAAGIVLGLVFLVMVRSVGPWLLLVPAAVLAVSLITFIAGASFSPLSEQALRARPRWQAFARYLRGVAKGQQAMVGERLVEEYLPYAAAFGLASDWAKYLKDQQPVETLPWFRPLATASDGGSGAFVAMMAAGSSVSSSSGGAAGGGAAGGGASGAS